MTLANSNGVATSPDYNNSNKRLLQHHNKNSGINNRFTSLLILLLGGIVGHLHGRYVAVNKNDHNNNDNKNRFETTVVKHPSNNSSSGSSSSSTDSILAISSKQQRATTTTTTSHDGWHTIQVFHGDTERQLKNSKKRERRSYSQVKQDLFVLGLFRNKKGGYFIDLASNDAIALSNTLGLEMKADWTGLCIEPNPFYWFSLVHFRKCQLVTAVVGKNRMDPIDFSYLGGVYGGIIDKGFDNKNPKLKRQSKLQFTVPLQEVFERNNVPKVIDYMSLDVEGAEEFIMEHFPFSNYKFSVLTVERPSSGLQELLNKTGYFLLRRLSPWGETLWVHESVMSELDLTVFKSES